MLYLIVICALTISSLLLGGARWYWIEVFRSYFSFFILFHLITLSLLFTRTGMRRKLNVFLLLGTLGILVAYLVTIEPYLKPAASIACRDVHETCTRTTAMYLDLSKTIEGDPAVSLFIAQEGADILVLSAYSDEWEKTLNLQKRFPYSIISKKSHELWLALFSNRPFTESSRTLLGDDIPLPAIIAELKSATEGAPPFRVSVLRGEDLDTPSLHQQNRIYFRRGASFLRRDDESGIVFLGDVGSVISPNYTQFLWGAYYQPTVRMMDLNSQRITHLRDHSPTTHILAKGSFRVVDAHEKYAPAGGFSAMVVTIESSL